MVKKQEVIIFGTGDIAQLAHFYLTHDSPHQVAAFCADAEFIHSNECLGLPLAPFEEIVNLYPPNEFDMLVALSYSQLNEVRARKYKEAKEKGYRLISYVSTRSVVWDQTEIGDNCLILENQTIQPFVKIGNNVILWSGNHIGHHSSIGDHCFVASHVVVSGHVQVGPYCFLGVNSTLRDGIKVATRSIIGAGATILQDTVEEGVYVGPAGELRGTHAKRVRL